MGLGAMDWLWEVIGGRSRLLWSQGDLNLKPWPFSFLFV